MGKANQQLDELIMAGQLADEEFIDAVPSVIIPAHEDFYKLLAYAGPPPRERMTRGVTKFSSYVPWIRKVSLGLRTMYPDMQETDIYSFTIQFTDWCRQQRTKGND